MVFCQKKKVLKQPEDIIVQIYILCTPIADAIVTDVIKTAQKTIIEYL